MEKALIEKRIEERAESRLSAELQQLKRLVYNDKILSRIKIGETSIYSQLPDECYPQHLKKCSESVQNAFALRRNELIQEETDNLLTKIETISYLFNQT